MSYKPSRMCIACRERKQKDDLIKILNNNSVLAIALGHMDGCRSLYICKKADCINLVIKKKILNKVLKKEIDSSFYEQLKEYCSE